MFFCPGCQEVHAPDTSWSFNGDLVHPTLNPSILVTQNLEDGTRSVCHSYVKDGKIEFLSDCTHAMAGQTVDLPAWEMCQTGLTH